jgi:hypothetical protein
MKLSLEAQEFPAAVPLDQPDWNESYLLAGFDGAAGVGFWMHVARWRRDLGLWREVFTVALPDGTVLAHRGVGNALAGENGPGATNYAVRVEEPGRRLTYTYRGGVHRVPATDLAQGLLINGYMTPLELDLVFEATTPVWDLHQEGGSQEFLGAAHIEQIGRVTGTIRVGGTRYAIDAMGTRDKSMGPRKPRNLNRHHWIQGLFDNGIGFMLFDAEEGEAGFSLGVVTRRDRIFEARITIPYRIERLDQQRDPVRLLLDYAEGTLDIRTTAIPNSWYLSYTFPIDTYIGVHPVAGGTPRIMLEQSARWILNDAVPGIGAIERTIPGIIGQEPD